jgi:hypothetical protein
MKISDMEGGMKLTIRRKSSKTEEVGTIVVDINEEEVFEDVPSQE